VINALVLHNMGDPAGWREAIADFELAFARYAPGVRCIVHDAALPVPEYVREFPFDLIVLNSTFLGAVMDRRALAALRERFGFIAKAAAYKVAMPQDDYYCSEELDRLVTEWKMDVVYTVCPEHWDVLYPAYLAAGGRLVLGYTGYVTPRMRRLADITIAREQRRFDVVYRASGRPTFPNGLAMVKSRLGDRFKAQFADRSWAMDITTDDRRVITGAAWWRFLADSRVTLGSNSGSDVLIRNLDVTDRIRAYQAANPEASHRQVLDACVPAADRSLEFTAISPRVMEAALVETTQLLVPGTYSGVITAGEHYWPLREDCTNREEVIALMEDRPLQSRIAGACREAIRNTPALQVEGLLENISAGAAAHSRPPVAGHRFAALRARYHADVEVRKRLYYARARAHGDRRPPGTLVTEVRRAAAGRAPEWIVAAYQRLRAPKAQS
jgi:hypothetical protein